jgi:hypothetical protein
MKILSTYFLAGVFLLTGCEFGNENRIAGIEGTGEKVGMTSAYGTVSGFGSIYVNGVRFDTDHADVEIAGEPATEEALAVGMLVEVTGEMAADGESRVARNIRAERALFGVIDHVEEVGQGRKAVQVLGQTVYVNEDAAFDGTTFDELVQGMGVGVSGFVTDNGLITATYLIKKEIDVATDTVEVEGYVSSIDPVTQTFRLKDLSVQTAAAVFINGTAAELVSGRRVRTSGILLGEPKILQAGRVEFISRPIEDDAHTSIEGVIRNLNAGATFMVHTTLVDLRNAWIENGSAFDLQEGAQVVVFGPLVQGVLRAERIHMKPLNASRFKGLVSDLDPAVGTFRLLGTQFRVTSFTQFKDDSATMERRFNFASLRDGEELEVFAVNVDGTWQATRIMRREKGMGPRDLLRGEITELDENYRGFLVANIWIDASELPEHEWTALRDSEDFPLNVDVEGFYTGDAQFQALRVHVHPQPPCSPHVFFECEDEHPPVPPPPVERK